MSPYLGDITIKNGLHSEYLLCSGNFEFYWEFPERVEALVLP